MVVHTPAQGGTQRLHHHAKDAKPVLHASHPTAHIPRAVHCAQTNHPSPAAASVPETPAAPGNMLRQRRPVAQQPLGHAVVVDEQG